jgi:hypothetical protein
MSGRKITSDHEAILDDYLISACEPVSTKLHDISFTPNMITTIGLVMGILSILFLWKKHYMLSFVFLWLCYWFDCLDGYYARKYKMETQFGDYYDHFRDIFVISIMVILLTIKLQSPYRYFFIATIVMCMYFVMVQMSCQEKVSKYKNANKTLDVFDNICPSDGFIRYSRIAGCGTLILCISFFIMILWMTESRKI